MIKAVTENDELVNVKATKDGKLMVETGTGEEASQTIETTLNASVQTLGAAATTIAINKKVTQIDIANYSETANITLSAGGITAIIGSNLTTTIKLNKQVDNISLTSTEENTKVQLVVSGVE